LALHAIGQTGRYRPSQPRLVHLQCLNALPSQMRLEATARGFNLG
jgi:hypothetical protein